MAPNPSENLSFELPKLGSEMLNDVGEVFDGPFSDLPADSKILSEVHRERKIEKFDVENYAKELNKRALLLLIHAGDFLLVKHALARAASLTPKDVPDFRRNVSRYLEPHLLKEMEEFVQQLHGLEKIRQLKLLQEFFNFLYFGSSTRNAEGSVFWHYEKTDESQTVRVSDYRRSQDEETEIRIPKNTIIWHYHFIPLMGSELPQEMVNELKYIGLIDFIESVNNMYPMENPPELLVGYTNIEMGIMATALGFKVEDLELIVEPPVGSSFKKKIRVVLTGKESADFLRKTKHGRKVTDNTNIQIRAGEQQYKLDDENLANSLITVIQKRKDVDMIKLIRLKSTMQSAAYESIKKVVGEDAIEHTNLEAYCRGRLLLVTLQELAKRQSFMPAE